MGEEKKLSGPVEAEPESPESAAAPVEADAPPVGADAYPQGTQPGGPEKPAKKKLTGGQLLAKDLIALLIKITVILLAVVLTFSFLFGVYRNTDPSMQPSFKDGDLVFYYRLDKVYFSGDVVVVKYEGRMMALRVKAVAGDVVDINENGLYINGSLQSEPGIYEHTQRFEEGVDFPLTVREGEIFVLGDARGHAIDSRVFGVIKISDTYGEVMAIYRRRSI